MYIRPSVTAKNTTECTSRPNPVGLPPCAIFQFEYVPVIDENNPSTIEYVIGFART